MFQPPEKVRTNWSRLRSFSSRLDAMLIGEAFLVGIEWAGTAWTELRAWRLRTHAHYGHPGAREVQAIHIRDGLVVRRVA
jgi:hypothetical protein